MRTLLRRAAATAAVTAGIAAGGAVVPAAATVQYAVDSFRTCMDWDTAATGGCVIRAEGSVTWHNRTATITGKVINGHGQSATAFFRAYAGSTKIDETTRTASGVSTTPFSFVIGDPDLVGGINRITISIQHYADLVVSGETETELRD
jgi:hypothetical protein